MLQDWFPNRTKVMLEGLRQDGLTQETQDLVFTRQSESL